MRLDLLAERLGAALVGDGSVELHRVNTIESAVPGELTFVHSPRYAPFIETTQASAIIVKSVPPDVRGNFIVHPDPYFAFAQAMMLFYPEPGSDLPNGIAKTAVISPNASLPYNIHIGNFVEIGEDTYIDESTKIMSGSYVGSRVTIGKNCLIFPNVTIYDGTIIGDNVAIHAGTVIGSDGFGYATHDSIHYKIYQIGIVRIEDDVEIGANCTIDRAALGETVIGAGTKIDNLVQIAHNVKIGKRCLIVSQAGISGSTQIGDDCVLAGQAGLVGHIKIGDRTIIAAQSGVSKNLESGKIYAGSPARELMEWKRLEGHLRRLPQRDTQIKQLESELAELRKRIEDLVKSPRV